MSVFINFTNQLDMFMDATGIAKQMEEDAADILDKEGYEHSIYASAAGIFIDATPDFNMYAAIAGEILEAVEERIAEAGIGVHAFLQGHYYGVVSNQRYGEEYGLPSDSMGRYIEFELIEKEALDPFLDKASCVSGPYRTPEAEEVLRLYQEEGMEGKTFQDLKSVYLSDLATHWFLMHLDAAEAQIRIGVANWYTITICIMCPDVDSSKYVNDWGWKSGYLADEKRWTLCGYNSVEDELEKKLEELFYIASTDEEDAIVGSFSSLEFGKAVVFNVGQALCVGVYSIFQYSPWNVVNRIAAFFDFGVPYVGATPQTLAAADYAAIAAEMGSLAGKRLHIYIVLSHWHMDHCILAKKFGAELAQTTWVVPVEGMGAAAQRIRQHIRANGGRVAAVSDSVISLSLGRNSNICYGKIDYGKNGSPGEIRASKHPHHHGIYVTLKLNSGNTVFLSGDCTYEGINHTLKQRGYTYLQASHHGGNYGLAPSTMNSGFIPRRDGGNGIVIYSCGPFSRHHHPSQESIDDHDAAGWDKAKMHNTHTGHKYVIT